ncbi:hypothetical protein VP1G_03416 [Cytospora mali]|uniref:Uncharacterized protein n=1 Tax=Cytospora mali TaxID=578113 RepID=A0A194UWL0_CYTMA|nr:hypothetical protein VP1G_03416 [Valsa mali var. pyri (nom. inval.)]
MEAQLREWQGRMSPEVLRKPALRMANMFTGINLCGYPLLELPSYKAQNRGQPSAGTHVDPSRLFFCVENLRKWYDYIASLPESEFANFAHTDWARFIGTVVLGLRMSFPIPNECPGWDHAAARQVLDLGTFLDRFRIDDGDTEKLTPASSKKITNTDVLSASKVVLGVVKRKYEKRLAALRKAAAMEPPHHMPPDTERELRKCPMFDGSIDPYIQSWDVSFLNSGTFASPPPTTSALNTGSFTVTQMGSAPGAQPVIFHDLWATMTMGWSQEGFRNVDFRDI